MFCKYCGENIVDDAVICPKCGRQVGEVKIVEDKPWSTIEFGILFMITLFIPLIGFCVGLYAMGGSPGPKRDQGISLFVISFTISFVWFVVFFTIQNK